LKRRNWSFKKHERGARWQKAKGLKVEVKNVADENKGQKKRKFEREGGFSPVQKKSGGDLGGGAQTFLGKKTVNATLQAKKLKQSSKAVQRRDKAKKATPRPAQTETRG